MDIIIIAVTRAQGKTNCTSGFFCVYLWFLSCAVFNMRLLPGDASAPILLSLYCDEIFSICFLRWWRPAGTPDVWYQFTFICFQINLLTIEMNKNNYDKDKNCACNFWWWGSKTHWSNWSWPECPLSYNHKERTHWKKNPWKILEEFSGKIEGPKDWSREHDHYLYGVPKSRKKNPVLWKDKEWGLTDCISFIVMKDHGLKYALTSDEHFQQAGYISLLME